MFGLRLGVIDRATFRAKIEHIFILRLCGRVNSRINRGAARITDRPGGKPLTCAVIGIVCIAIGSIAAIQIFIFSHIIADIRTEIYGRCIYLKLHALCKAVMKHSGNALFIRIRFRFFFNDRSER